MDTSPIDFLSFVTVIPPMPYTRCLLILVGHYVSNYRIIFPSVSRMLVFNENRYKNKRFINKFKCSIPTKKSLLNIEMYFRLKLGVMF